MSLLMSLLTAFLICVGLVTLARLWIGEELFEPRRRRGRRGF